MALFRTEGWILREFPFGESSKMLLSFTERRGRIKLIAKGSRRPTSRLRSSLELYTLSDLVLYEREGREFFYVREASPILQPKGVRTDLAKLKFVGKIAQLLEKLLPEGMRLRVLFKELRDALPLILEEDEKGVLYPALHLRILEATGNLPLLERCVKCGCKGELSFFSSEEGGVLCGSCASSGLGFPISRETGKLLQTISKWPLRKLARIRVDIREVERLLRGFTEVQLGVYIPDWGEME